MLGYTAWGATSAGGRKVNQDRILLGGRILPDGDGPDCTASGGGEPLAAAVADGITGCAGGGFAAQKALELVRSIPAAHFMEYPISGVNQVNAGVASAYADMYGEDELGGCTLSLLLVSGENALAVNVGDSPVFLLRGGLAGRLGGLVRLSRPHTMGEYKRSTREGGVTVRDEHCLYEFIGNPDTSGDTAHFDQRRLRCGDTVLIVSDGVSEALPARRIARLIGGADPARSLVEAAYAARQGESDNLSAVVVRFSRG